MDEPDAPLRLTRPRLSDYRMTSASATLMLSTPPLPAVTGQGALAAIPLTETPLEDALATRDVAEPGLAGTEHADTVGASGELTPLARLCRQFLDIANKWAGKRYDVHGGEGGWLDYEDELELANVSSAHVFRHRG